MIASKFTMEVLCAFDQTWKENRANNDVDVTLVVSVQKFRGIGRILYEPCTVVVACCSIHQKLESRKFAIIMAIVFDLVHGPHKIDFMRVALGPWTSIIRAERCTHSSIYGTSTV